MLPHERSLVKRLAEKPFALLGISGGLKDSYRKAVKEEPIPWRSWLDDDGDPVRGPIARTWNVATWPTLYLLDSKGVIRRKWLGAPDDKELDDAVDSLIAETEKKTD
jgi:hypothetical protein